MKPKPSGMESITLRRAVLADSDKVRYKVYSSPTEFIAVIAESALMAVKVSGIGKPHKIIRDLPTEGVAIEAKKMAAVDPDLLRITVSMEKSEKKQILVAELAEQKKQQARTEENFRPMNIADLQHDGKPRARILPPDLLSEIIAQHTKSAMPPSASAEPIMAASTLPEPALSAVHAEPIAQAPLVPEVMREPELSTQEKILQMADEVLASAVEAPVEPIKDLSPDDVKKLLHE